MCEGHIFSSGASCLPPHPLFLIIHHLPPTKSPSLIGNLLLTPPIAWQTPLPPSIPPLLQLIQLVILDDVTLVDPTPALVLAADLSRMVSIHQHWTDHRVTMGIGGPITTMLAPRGEDEEADVLRQLEGLRLVVKAPM